MDESRRERRDSFVLPGDQNAVRMPTRATVWLREEESVRSAIDANWFPEVC
jgi:hypothetical protein